MFPPGSGECPSLGSPGWVAWRRSYDGRMNDVEAVDYSQWKTWVEDNDAVILDIRQPFEWELGTLPDSILIPMTELLARVAELPRDRAILCVCRSGSRSDRVAAYLRSAGFERAVNMEGGLKALGMQD